MDSSDSDSDIESGNDQLNEHIEAAAINDQSNSQNWSINNSRSSNPQHNGSNENQVDTNSDSEDNLDNPSYLKQMCAGFVNKIKEKNETISIFKRMVINNNLQLVQMNSFYQGKIRRMQYLSKLKAGDENKPGNNSSREIGKDPLTLLPEEVWTILLSQVTDAKDLLSLSRTCLLFQEILNKTKNEWLFVNVFPYLFNHLPRKDILQCRLVCKRWSSSVDTFIENYKLRQPYSPNVLKGGLVEDM